MYNIAKANTKETCMPKLITQLAAKIFTVQQYSVFVCSFPITIHNDSACIQNPAFCEKSCKHWRQGIWLLCKNNFEK